MFFELREYPIKPGQMERWVTYMDEVLIPYQVSQGMVIVGSWFAAAENRYFWIRRFEDEAEKERLYAAVYKNERWLNEIKPLVDEMLDRELGLKISVMEPSPRSILR